MARCPNCTTETTYFKGKESGYITTALCPEHQAEQDAQNEAYAIKKPYIEADPIAIMKAVKSAAGSNLVTFAPALSVLAPSLMVKDWDEIKDSLDKVVAQGGIPEAVANSLKNLLKTEFKIDLDNIPL